MWPFQKRTVLPRVEVLNLQPGDFLVIETRERIPPMAVEAMREQLSTFTGVDERRVIVVYNASLKVLRQGDPPPPPVIIEPATEFRF